MEVITIIMSPRIFIAEKRFISLLSLELYQSLVETLITSHEKYHFKYKKLTFDSRL